MENEVETLYNLFVNRIDTYAIQNEDGTYTRMGKPQTEWKRKKLRLDKELTKGILARHLKGEITIGGYQLHPSDSAVKWICFDLDIERIADTDSATKKIFELCKAKFGEKSILAEASGTLGSKHVWIFLDPPVPASVAKHLGETILKLSNVQEVELFPKQQKAEFGNLVKLPLGIHRKSGNWSKLLDPEMLKPIDAGYLKDIVPAKIGDEEVSRIKEELNKKSWRPQQGAVFSDAPYKGERMGCIKKILEGLAEHGTKDTHGRNIGAAILAGDLLNFRKQPPDIAWKELQEWNNRNKPPVSENELRATFASHIESGMSYGCDHEWKRAFCAGRDTCPLFRRERETLEALRFLAEEPVFERFLVNINKTLKADLISKKLVFLTALSAYGDNPLNLYMKGPASTGKTACTVAVTEYFPKEDVWSLGGMTPKALIHQKSRYDKEAGRHVIELWNKILLFLDTPNLETLDMLKPILSHDKIEIEYRWTDPEKLRTKKVFIRGWPATIFCTTQTKLLQEIASRGMTATPEINEAKFKAVIEFKGDRLVQPWKYHAVDEEREMIKRAIACMKSPGVRLAERPHAVIPYARKLADRFPKSEAQYLREFDKYCGLIAMHAFLHQHQRFIRQEEVDGKPVEYIIADERDYEEGTRLYSAVQEATVSGVPAHVIEFFDRVHCAI